MLTVLEVSAIETFAIRREVLYGNAEQAPVSYPSDHEPDARHFAAYQDRKIVGTLSLYLRPHEHLTHQDCAQLRALVARDSMQDQTISKHLLEYAERYAKSKGCTALWSNARLGTVGYYQTQGYRIASEEFILPNIGPHHLMIKEGIKP